MSGQVDSEQVEAWFRAESPLSTLYLFLYISITWDGASWIKYHLRLCKLFCLKPVTTSSAERAAHKPQREEEDASQMNKQLERCPKELYKMSWNFIFKSVMKILKIIQHHSFHC